jgi:hypothetical protein
MAPSLSPPSGNKADVRKRPPEPTARGTGRNKGEATKTANGISCHGQGTKEQGHSNDILQDKCKVTMSSQGYVNQINKRIRVSSKRFFFKMRLY